DAIPSRPSIALNTQAASKLAALEARRLKLSDTLKYLRTKLTQRGPDKRRRGNKDVARVALKLLQTGKPWDLKIGGAAHDVLTKEGEEGVSLQTLSSAVSFFAPDCKTLSRARDRPIRGLPRWKQLPRLRSKNFPLGLPYLAAHDKEKVETSNLIARRTASWCKALRRAGLAFIIENPDNSYLWMLEEYLELAKLSGVRDIDSHNCMRGGDRKKFAKFRVFKCAEAEKTLGKVCREEGGVCDKSGVPHMSFKPVVSPDGNVTFKTEGEAEYPQGMCDAIAEVVKAHPGTLSEEEKARLVYSFSEIFAEPNAPATTAVQSLESSHPADLPALVEGEMEDAPTAAAGMGEPCAAEENSRIPGAAGGYEAKIWRVLKTKPSKGIDEGTDMDLERTGVWNNSIIRKHPGPDRPGKVVLRTSEESNRDRRARENRECLGGMRSPWRTVGKLPSLRKVGKRCRKVVEDYLTKHPEALAIMRGLGSTPDDEGRARIAEVGGEIRSNLKSELRAGNEVSAAKCKWDAGLLKAFLRESEDPDQELAEWAVKGAPMGVAVKISQSGIFPEVADGARAQEDLNEIVTKFEPAANYKSVERQREPAAEEIDRVITKGYASWRATWEELLEEFGEVVASKMACIIKERPDGTLKVRLVADLRRSGCNEFVSASERIVLPRPSEAVEDITALSEALEEGEEVWLGVADFAGAFHTWALHPSERKFVVVRHPKKGYVVYDTVLFGGAGCLLVWGRGAAFLGRAGQSLFECDELRIEVYVDEPLIAIRGTEREATRKMLTLLLFWAAFGPDIAWNKASFGRSATWIGAKFDVLDGENFSVEIPEKYTREMREETEDLSNKKAADINRMQKFVGKGSWASGLVPILGTMLSPLWAAMKDVNKSGVIDDSNEGLIPIVRIAHALAWLREFFKEENREKYLKRQYFVIRHRWSARVCITVDASPRGFGAWLAVDGTPSTWLAGAWTDEDATRLGARIGNCQGQNAWEALGILICFRTWLCTVAKERVRLRSDSVNALVAIAKERSKSQAVNLIAREIALDLAELNYVVDLETVHLPAVFNDWADALSRMCEDDKKYTREIKGNGYSRVRACTCLDFPVPLCTIHCSDSVVRRVQTEEATGDSPLLPTESRKFPSAAGTAETWKKWLEGLTYKDATGHSPRRSGAQSHTRLGVPVWLVAGLGRWGSRAVFGCIEGAIREEENDEPEEACLGPPQEVY
ncbi:unnamed protein product, partial [Polarella glacialis]